MVPLSLTRMVQESWPYGMRGRELASSLTRMMGADGMGAGELAI